MSTNYATSSFEIRDQEYQELEGSGLTILRDRYLKRETGIIPKRMVALLYKDKWLIGRVSQVDYRAGKWDVSVQLVKKETDSS